METGDGLIARVRAPRGRLSLDQAAAAAQSALRCGNGSIGLSARANLHLRGLSERSLPDLRRRLGEAGLLDADPEIERLRNIVASPLDDIDPEALIDLSPSAAALEAELAKDGVLRQLPAKFGFVLDARGRLPLADVEADIRFEASLEGTLAVYLAGDDALAAESASAATGEIAARLGGAFVRLTGAGDDAPRRMRALVQRIGASAVFAEARLETRRRARSEWRASPDDFLGAREFGAAVVVGAAAAFGEIGAASLDAAIKRARALGANGLRLTPWRAFLITGLNPESAEAMTSLLERLGFIVRADESRLSVAACPGGPACIHGHRPVREDASRFAPLLPKGEGVVLHVSGCAKGCARAAQTAVTLTATETGYDLILAGKAGDPPVRRGLSAADIEKLLVAEGATLFAGERRSP
jgi:precorrin-3B synthase